MPKAAHHIRITEKKHVEDSFLAQLEGLGWNVKSLEMKHQKPADSGRDSLNDVVLLPALRESLARINDWMDDEQIEQSVARITNISGTDLLANNQHVLQLMLEGTTTSRNRKTGEVSPTVHYIDFKHPENNTFTAVSQLKIRVPGTDTHIFPDIILFLNGLPVAVVECKSPKAKEPVAEAIDQMMRYSEQRGASGEGNRKLFYYNQFLVATCRQEAKVSSVEENTVPVMFVVDEAAHVPVANLKELPGVGRGRRFAVMLFYQNLSQGYDMYGEHGFNSILGSINTKTFLPGCDHVTARYASEIVGQTTVWGRGFDDAPGTENDKSRSTEASRALIDPNEVRQLPVHRQAITVIETMPPVKWTYPKSAKEPPRIMPRKYSTPRIVNFTDAERETLKRKLLNAATGEDGKRVEADGTHTAEQTPPQGTANESSTVATVLTKQNVSKAANETVARKQEPIEQEPIVLSKIISPETVYAVTREAIDHLADLYDDPPPSSSPDVQIIPIKENSLDRVLNP